MKSIKRSKRITQIYIILSIIIISNIFFILSDGILNNSQTDLNNNEREEDPNPLSILKTNAFGEADWWDHSYEYRMLINITNPYPYDIENYGVNISFTYSNLLSENKIQSDLDDIRIIENDILKNYYVKKDYPSVGIATVWFDTNILANSIETDTYLYFGNPSAVNNASSDSSESFGWIKNGDFEIDISSATNFDPFGWSFSNNPVDTIVGLSQDYPDENTPIGDFVNCLIDDTTGDHRIGSGVYAYKWGVNTNTPAGSSVNDYAGTLFSYPFKVPTINGGDIYLKLFRNIRTYHFERKTLNPKNDEIQKDGYFIRVLNASDYNSDPDTHSDVDIQQSSYENYLEAYDGFARKTAFWSNEKDLIQLHDGSNFVHDDDIIKNTGSSQELTGYMNLDLTQYMGETLFFEIGAWGEETTEKNAFFQVDSLEFNYFISTSLNEIQARRSDITVVVRDIDGQFVPNAEVYLINNSATIPIVDSKISSTVDGSAEFIGILNGIYNFTVNYTMGSYEAEVYNSTKLNKILYEFDGKEFTVEIYVNLWTINFEFTDSDGIPFNYGYLKIKDDKAGTTLRTINLDSEGKATFRWLNTAYYYYELYYNNEDYADSPFLLNQSNYIYRSDYESVKEQQKVISVVNNNQAPSGESWYLINQYVYSNGSSSFNNRNIIQANITLTDMTDQLVNVSIYYIDEDNSTGIGDENLIYFEEDYGYGVYNDFISLDFLSIENTKLESENFNVYGLKIVIYGLNSSTCNGLVMVDSIETCHIFNKTELSRLNIRVINMNDLFPEGQPLNALIRVEDDSGTPLINLTSIAVRDGYAYGEKNAYDIPFWFFKDYNYTFRIDVLNYTDVEFNITSIGDSRWIPTGAIQSYEHYFNSTMMIEFNVIFETEFNISSYNTAIFNVTHTNQVQWGENLYYKLDFMYTEDDGETWEYVTNPGATCRLYVYLQGESEILLQRSFQNNGNGTFTLILNSSVLSAGYDSKTYTMMITGNKPGYPLPNEVFKVSTINAVPAEMSAYDHDTLIELPFGEYEASFNELIQMTVQYYDSLTHFVYEDVLLTYEWINLDPVIIQPDPINIGYYTFTLNTSDALSTGLESIKIKAYLENHSLIGGYFEIELTIMERNTKLNGEINPQPISMEIWVEDFQYFVYEYTDAETSQLLSGLSIATFNWYEMDNSGSFLNSSGGGSLISNINKTYTLDFNTGYRNPGFYLITVSLKKDNYERKQMTLIINIKLREMEYDLTATNLKGNRINIAHGTQIEFQLQINDLSRGGILLQNADVSIILNQVKYNFTETSPGIYIYSLSTTQFDAFFTSYILSGTLEIQVANFTSIEIGLTVVIKMEEIFPGIPTFYFLLLISAIIAVTGSLVAYRVIHYARIPNYVKKIMKVRKVIKSKKKFIEPIKAPSKEAMIVSMLGDEWKQIGISLNKKLDVKGKAKLIKKEKITKQGEDVMK